MRTCTWQNGITENVDEATDDNSPFTTDSVGDITGDESAKEGTSGENRSDQRKPLALEGGSAAAFDEIDEDFGSGHTVDVTRVVTEENTTERGESANEVGLEGDRRLDAIHIAGGSETRTRHDGGLLLL